MQQMCRYDCAWCSMQQMHRCGTCLEGDCLAGDACVSLACSLPMQRPRRPKGWHLSKNVNGVQAASRRPSHSRPALQRQGRPQGLVHAQEPVRPAHRGGAGEDARGEHQGEQAARFAWACARGVGWLLLDGCQGARLEKRGSEGAGDPHGGLVPGLPPCPPPRAQGTSRWVTRCIGWFAKLPPVKPASAAAGLAGPAGCSWLWPAQQLPSLPSANSATHLSARWLLAGCISQPKECAQQITCSQPASLTPLPLGRTSSATPLAASWAATRRSECNRRSEMQHRTLECNLDACQLAGRPAAADTSGSGQAAHIGCRSLPALPFQPPA